MTPVVSLGARCECVCHGCPVPRDICVHCWTKERSELFRQMQDALTATTPESDADEPRWVLTPKGLATIGCLPAGGAA